VKQNVALSVKTQKEDNKYALRQLIRDY
jgi:hypothetical protein